MSSPNKITIENQSPLLAGQAAIAASPVLPAVFSSEEMIAFGNFIRDNYYVAGSPKMLSYHPEKYPHGKVDDIFVYWCLGNGR